MVGASAAHRLHGSMPVASQLGKSEIQNLRLPAIGDEDVGRLDIAVNDALAMGYVERVGDLDADVEQLVGATARPGSSRSGSRLPAAPWR